MKRTVLIIGGGLAGITTALRLSARGYRVTIVEQSHTWGGRVTAGSPAQIDPLPVVLLGCHHATQALLHTLGTAARVNWTSKLSFEFVTPWRAAARLCRPLVPAPWSALLGLTGFRALSLRDRWAFLTWVERTWERDPALPADLDNHTAEAWLRGIGQSEQARIQAWTPLSRFLLGDDLKNVSAALFLGMLIRCFTSSRRHSMLAVPNDSLERLITAPAIHALEHAGATMQLNTPVDHIYLNAQGVTGVRLHDGSTLAADWYVAAVSQQALSPLLPERAVTRFSYFQQLPMLADGAAIAAHLWMNRPLSGPRVLLLANRPYHWVILRSDPKDNQRMLASLIATGQIGRLDQSDKEVLDLAITDLTMACPDLRRVSLSHHEIVRVARAFLCVRPRTTALRPLQQSPFPNFFLAGGWTDTGLPATLESTILSGDLCARAICAKSAVHPHSGP
ncbi:MAG TPA: FAD-dependent oxidoreductase [Nitrospiraceae bacterium]|nr:FAD-dependent oxidoreductase [Nitrospiraceae bacterium]